MAVPWHCPACNTVLRHGELDSKPEAGARYRCHICRLTLDFDADLGKLVVAPFETDHASEFPPSRSRTLPSPISNADAKARPKPRPRHK
jgi:hypothetical protein